jgi:hypothetical protein
VAKINFFIYFNDFSKIMVGWKFSKTSPPPTHTHPTAAAWSRGRGAWRFPDRVAVAQPSYDMAVERNRHLKWQLAFFLFVVGFTFILIYLKVFI